MSDPLVGIAKEMVAALLVVAGRHPMTAHDIARCAGAAVGALVHSLGDAGHGDTMELRGLMRESADVFIGGVH